MQESIDPRKVMELVNSGAPIDARELSALLRCSLDRVRRQAKAGVWPASKPGREYVFLPEQVREIQRLCELPRTA